MGGEPYLRGLGVEWRETPNGLRPFKEGREVAWAPQDGAQAAFLECIEFEVLAEGPRGGGKTEALLMDFCQHCGVGFGRDWRGILFRRTFKQLEDVIAKTKKWIPRIFPMASYNEGKSKWIWPTGEELLLRYMDHPRDFDNYKGHEYPWMGWEELTTWPNDECYKPMLSVCRSSRPGMPRKCRATTNPYGVGHGWVKARWSLPVVTGLGFGPKLVTELDGEFLARRSIRFPLEENQALLRADPHYLPRVGAAARNSEERKAWVEGNWNIVAGGMFNDCWRPEIHVVPDVDPRVIPRGWRINRAFDHGRTRPFAVLWCAESNGEPIQVDGRSIGGVRGDLLVFAEWYGWTGIANEGINALAIDIGRGILDRDERMGLQGKIGRSVADSSVFDEDASGGKSVAGDMRRIGVPLVPADKGPGSRVQGWEQVRKYLFGAIPDAEGCRELAGVFFCRRCEQSIRTIPALPRDPSNLDDVDTEAEDHLGDALRYRVRTRPSGVADIAW